MPWIVLFPVLATAAFTDTRWGKIWNWLTMPALLGGLIYAGVTGGWPGFAQSLLGAIAIAPLVYAKTVQINMGDVKLVMVVGAWLGIIFVIPFALSMWISRAIFAIYIRICVNGLNLKHQKEKIVHEVKTMDCEEYGSVGAQIVLAAVVLLFCILNIPLPPFEWMSANVIR